jgi:hypothetical protein
VIFEKKMSWRLIGDYTATQKPWVQIYEIPKLRNDIPLIDAQVSVVIAD